MVIAILGLGTVGKGVLDIANSTKEIKVKYILVRKGKELIDSRYTDDFNMIINDDEVDLIVETIGGIEPARTYILEALKHHKHVVSANKAVISAYYLDFINKAKENKVKFLFEASTGGGIPIIKSLIRDLRFESIDSFHGILNGTSNFILDNMTRFKLDFDVALALAKEKGYAEADPTADIDGIDTANKIRIIANLVNKDYVTHDFLVEGIRNISAKDINYYENLGYRVRLIAKLINTDSEYNLYVIPKLFMTHEIEANILLNNNLCSYSTKTLGELKLVGQGAGRYPTANAIINDIMDILTGESFDFKVTNKKFYNPYLGLNNYLVRTSQDITSFLNEYHFEVDKYQDFFYFKIINLSILETNKLLDCLKEKNISYFIAEM